MALAYPKVLSFAGAAALTGLLLLGAWPRGVGGLGARAAGRRTRPAAAVAAAPNRVPRRAAVPVGRYGAPVGRRLVYDFELRTSTRLATVRAVPQTSAGALRGVMMLDVVARRGDEALVALHFDDLAGTLPRADAGTVPAALSVLRDGVLMRVGPDGAFELRWKRDAAAADRALLQGIALGFRFVVAAGAPPEWRRDERDLSGLAVVRYATADVDRVTRRKVRYRVEPAADTPPVEVEGDAEAEFDRSVGWFWRVRCDQVLTLSIPVMRARAVERYHATATLRGTESIEAVAEGHWDGPWQPPWSVVGADDEPRVDRAADPEVTLAALIAAVVADPAGGVQQLRAAAALLARDARAVARAEQMVRDGSLALAARRALASVLGMAGTGAAQSALARLLDASDLPRQLRVAAAGACFRLSAPTDALRGALWRAAAAPNGTLAGTSLLAIGSLAERREPSAGRDLERLLAFETRARRADRVPAWLEALGNAGRVESLEVAERYLRDADPGVRLAAVRSLRRLSAATAGDALATAATGDAAAGVRACAVRLLAPHAVSHRAALLQALQTDADPAVRWAAIAALATRCASPVVRRALQSAAQSDADAGVRRCASRVLSR